MFIKGYKYTSPIFLLSKFYPIGFTCKVFNETILIDQEQSKELQKYCTIFPSLDFSHGFLNNKVLLIMEREVL